MKIFWFRADGRAGSVVNFNLIMMSKPKYIVIFKGFFVA